MLSTVIATIFLVMSFCSSLIILAVCVGAARTSRWEEVQEGIIIPETVGTTNKNSDWIPNTGNLNSQNI